MVLVSVSVCLCACLSVCVCVGSVTVFIDTCSFYIENRYTFPVVVDNVRRGWVNNIVFTSSAQRKVITPLHSHTVLVLTHVVSSPLSHSLSPLSRSL